MSKAVLEVRDLQVVRSQDFRLTIPKLTINPGMIVGVTGPNGSGKTTLLEALVGLNAVDRGVVLLDGIRVDHELFSVRSRLGFIPDDEQWFVPELTAAEYFELMIEVYTAAGVGVDMHAEVKDLARELQFVQFDRLLKHLSHGNKRKVQLITGLMHQPVVIVVDELRNGLDPLAVIRAEQIIQQRAKRGAVIIAATHDLWWTERMADETILLLDGRIQIQAKTKQLLRQHQTLESLFLTTLQEQA